MPAPPVTRAPPRDLFSPHGSGSSHGRLGPVLSGENLGKTPAFSEIRLTVPNPADSVGGVRSRCATVTQLGELDHRLLWSKGPILRVRPQSVPPVPIPARKAPCHARYRLRPTASDAAARSTPLRCSSVSLIAGFFGLKAESVAFDRNRYRQWRASLEIGTMVVGMAKKAGLGRGEGAHARRGGGRQGHHHRGRL